MATARPPFHAVAGPHVMRAARPPRVLGDRPHLALEPLATHAPSRLEWARRSYSSRPVRRDDLLEVRASSLESLAPEQLEGARAEPEVRPLPELDGVMGEPGVMRRAHGHRRLRIPACRVIPTRDEVGPLEPAAVLQRSPDHDAATVPGLDEAREQSISPGDGVGLADAEHPRTAMAGAHRADRTASAGSRSFGAERGAADEGAHAATRLRNS
jgi:hypothetical protein